jgi:hypothetical protein
MARMSPHCGGKASDGETAGTAAPRARATRLSTAAHVAPCVTRMLYGYRCSLNTFAPSVCVRSALVSS